MESHVSKIMKRSVCGEEEFEQKDVDHIKLKHGFDSPLQHEYIASLRRIRVLEERTKLLEGKSSRYP
jgi:hypothetical protein